MKQTTLNLLACPACHASLVSEGILEDRFLQSGSLTCVQCGKVYPVKDGIYRFVQEQELTGLNRRFATLYNWFSYVYRLYSKIAFAFIGGEDYHRRDIVNRLDIQGGKVLEVSIGPGVNLPYLMELPQELEIFGLDISRGQLEHCQNYCRKKKWAVDLFLGNAEELPFQDEVFDTVFHVGGINFFDDKKKAIEEMIRVAKPGSKLLILDENERGAKVYERTLPGFKSSFKDGRQPISAPVDLVPKDMADIQLNQAWGGWFYCLEFRKPGS